MKNILSLLAVLGLLCITVANAQNVSPPIIKSAITNVNAWQVTPAASDGDGNTNVPPAQAPWCVVGRDGFGVAIKSFGTNAALTTNTSFQLEFTADGVNAITNINVSVHLVPRGTATNVYYTNFVTSSSVTLGNVSAVRIKRVAATNGLIGSSLAGTLFVEKFQFLSR